jgi:hypothetical protein
MNNEYEKLLNKLDSDEFHDSDSFIRDGIISLDDWNSVPLKILFFNKEAYSKKNPRYDLREDLRGSAPFNSWWSATRWIYLLFKLYENIDLHVDIPVLKWQDANKLIRRVATINIKKSKGKSVSDNNELNNYLNHDGSLLKQQIELINPNIIMCGKVFHFYKNLYNTDKFIKLTEKAYLHNDRLIIDFWHFANRKKKELVFMELQKILKAPMVSDYITSLKA